MEREEEICDEGDQGRDLVGILLKVSNGGVDGEVDLAEILKQRRWQGD